MNELTEAGKREVAQELERLLADTYATYLKTQGFHWNVVGPSFPYLHEMFGKQYEELIPVIDELAERIRALGHSAPASFSQFARLTRVSEEHAATSPEAMLRQLVDANEQCARSARSTVLVAQGVDDEATADLAIQRVQAHDKAVWMLRATLQR